MKTKKGKTVAETKPAGSEPEQAAVGTNAAQAQPRTIGLGVRLVPAGGILVITVPYSYPYHPDPIDTLYRPSAEELCALFPGYEVLYAQLIRSESYGQEFVAGGPGRMVRKVLRMFFPFVRPKRWLSHAHRMLWLFRPYQLTGVILRKPPLAHPD